MLKENTGGAEREYRNKPAAVLKRNSVGAQSVEYSVHEGTPLTTNNVCRQLRHVMSLAGIEGVTPHRFRRNETVGPATAGLLEKAFR